MSQTKAQLIEGLNINTSAPADALVIDSSGNVAIGTSTIGSASLTLYGSNSRTMFQGSSTGTGNGNGFTTGNNGAADAFLWNYENGFVQVATNNTERLRIDNSGKVGIGTTSPGAALDVVGNSTMLRLYDGTNTSTGKISQSSDVITLSQAGTSSGALAFATGSGALGTERMRIDGSGRLLVGTTSGRNVGGGANALVQVETTSQNGISFVCHRGTSTSGSILVLGKSRGTAAGSSTVVANGDELGAIRFAGADGTDVESRAASIAAFVDGAPGSNDMPGRLVFNTTADGASSPTERMRIDSAGLVGIGTTSPAGGLHVDAASGVDGPVFDSGGTGNTNHALLVRDSGNNQLLRVNNNGNVGINTTSPSGKLDIVTGTTGNVLIDAEGGSNFHAKIVNDSGDLVVGSRQTSADTILTSQRHTLFKTGSSETERMRIDSSGRLLLGTTTEGYADADNLTIADSGNSGITIRSGASNSGAIFFSDATSGGGEYDGYIEYSQNSRFIRFGTAQAERMRIDSSGRLLLGTTTEGHVSADNFTVADSGHCGITIRSGTTSEGAIYFSDGTSGDAEYRGQVFYDHDGDYMRFSTAVTERLRITSTGRMGLGTTSPQQRQHIHEGSSAASVTQYTNSVTGSTANDGLLVGLDSTEDGLFWIKEAQNLTFGTANTERMRIDGSGNVGIGTSSPTSVLHIKSDTNNNVNNGFLFEAADSTHKIFRLYENGTGEAYSRWYYQDTAKVLIRTNGASYFTGGNVGVGTTSPASLLHLSGDQTALRIQRTSSIGFLYNVGTASTSATRLQAESGPLDLFTNANQPIIFKTNGDNERVRISGGGNLGIGTTSPSRDFHNANGVCLTTGAAPQYRLNGGSGDSNDNDRAIFGLATSTNHFFSGTSAGDTILRTTNGGKLLFGNGTNEQMRITSAGYFYVGTTTADGKAHVLETNAPQSMALVVRNTNSNNSVATNGIKLLYSVTPNDTNNAIQFSTNSGTPFVVRNNGNVQNTNGSYTSFSDARFKENIVDASSQWDDIKNIRIRNWNFRPELGWASHRMIGPVAQELELVSPGLVTDIPVLDDDNNPTGEVEKSVNQSVLYMKAVKALQEAIDRIETLETQNADLLARVTALEG